MSDEIQTKGQKPPLRLVYAASNTVSGDTSPTPADKRFALSLARSFDMPAIPASMDALCLYLQERIDFSAPHWREATEPAVHELEKQTQFITEFGRDYLLQDTTDYAYAYAAVLLSCCENGIDDYKNKSVRSILNLATDLRQVHGSFFDKVNTITQLAFMSMLNNEIETDLRLCEYDVMDTAEMTSRYLYQYAPIRNHIPKGSPPANFLRDAIKEIGTNHVHLGKPADVVRLPQKHSLESSSPLNTTEVSSKVAKREIAPSPDHDHILNIEP